jgi:hypothetical protein
MYLFLSIILSTVLGLNFWIMGPVFGSLVAFGIVVGSLFRGLYLLNEIHKGILGTLSEEEKSEVKNQQNHMKNAREYKRYFEERADK